MKKRERKYLSERYLNKDLFVDYLPTKIYSELTEEERINYREYRRYSYFVSRSNKKIEDLKQQLDEIQLKINKEIEKQKDVVDVYYSEDGNKQHRDIIELGWNSKVKNYYQKLTHIHQKFDFKIWWEKRPISNKTLDVKSGKKIISETEFLQDRKTYGGRELELRHRYYIKLKGVGTKPSKNIYLGDEILIRKSLSEIYKEDFSKDDWDIVKKELRGIIEPYVNFNLMNKGWKTFILKEYEGGESHSIHTIKDWCVDVGEDFHNYYYEKNEFTKELSK
jgi:hypothetical protein